MNVLRLAKDLVVGNTMSNDSAYFYGRLSTTGKSVYNSMVSGIKSFSADIMLPYVSHNEVSEVFNSVLRDNPLIFYTTSYSVTSSAQKRQCRFYPNYIYPQHIAKQHIDQVMRYLRYFDAVQGKPDIEKELYVHDFCLNHFTYDYAFGEHAFSVLGPVLKSSAVCEGIAKFVKLALDYLGVKNIFVSGNAIDPMNGTNSKHAWNMVSISEQTFHLDVTFNLTQKTAHNRYDYFNLCDNEIKKDHSFANIFPKCVTADRDYYSMYGMTANSPAELGSMIGNNIRQGKMITIAKLRNTTDAANILSKVVAIAERQYSSVHNRSFMVEVRHNPAQMVFEIEYK